MNITDMTGIALIVAIAVLGVFSHNYTVSISMVILLIIRFTPLHSFFPQVGKYGMSLGIVILMVGVMSPLASGKISSQDLLRSFTNWQSLLGIAVGILVAWLGGRGLFLMQQQPQLVAGLLIGTVLGVAFFKGVPVGPLIAAGILAVLLGKIH